MTGFHEVRFPDSIAYGATGVRDHGGVTGASHAPQRNVNWAEARGRWDVASGQAQLDERIAFFRARKGKAYGFRFKHWTDCKRPASCWHGRRRDQVLPAGQALSHGQCHRS